MRVKRSLTITLLAIVGAILIPIVVAVWPLAVRDPSVLIVTFSGIILLYVSLIGSAVLQLHESFLEKLSGLAEIREVPEGEFYPRFVGALHTASTHVKLTYLSIKSPLDSRSQVMRDYYRGLSAEIRKRPGVEFKRIVRAVPQLHAWIGSMVEELDGAGNFSLACLPGTDPIVDSVDAIAVQCVDDDKTFLVAVGRQQESREPRDLYVRSAEFNRVWSEYFDRLWSESVVIIDRGRVDRKNLEQVKGMMKV